MVLVRAAVLIAASSRSGTARAEARLEHADTQPELASVADAEHSAFYDRLVDIFIIIWPYMKPVPDVRSTDADARDVAEDNAALARNTTAPVHTPAKQAPFNTFTEKAYRPRGFGGSPESDR